MSPGRFRTKPVVIEAMRWDPTDAETANFVKGWLEQHGVTHWIESEALLIEGNMTAGPGDWIVRSDGEFSACKPDIFAAIYEPAPGMNTGLLPPSARRGPGGGRGWL